MKTFTFDIPTAIKTSISIDEDTEKDIEAYSEFKKKTRAEIILKILNDGLKKSEMKLTDLVEDSGFKKEMKYEVLKSLNEFLGTTNLSAYVREELKKRIKRDEKIVYH